MLRLRKVAGVAILIYSQATPAAAVYRCGNSYQDTPCVNAKAADKIIKNNTAAQSNSLAPIKIDADCKQLGEATKKISWAREVGKTLEQQLETAKDGRTQLLMREVYNHRGSSLDVRNAIEQECMQQKEQDKLADKLIIEAQKIRSKRGGNLESAANSEASHNSVSSRTKSANRISPDNEKHAKAKDNKAECSALKTTSEKIAQSRRRGGSASYMDDLKQRQNDVESQLNTLGC